MKTDCVIGVDIGTQGTRAALYDLGGSLLAEASEASVLLHPVPGAVEDYLGFLKAGASVYPLDALRRAGVDLSKPEPVERAFQVMDDYVTRLETLLPASPPAGV